MDPARELECVRRAQSGDRAAYEELIRAYARMVWACVYGLVRDATWTEDLVQDTFMKAWQSIKEMQEPAAFRGWLLTTARRLAWRHAEVSGRPLPPPVAPEESRDPEDAREQVQAALARLPDRYRLPVTLHFVNGMEYGAISKTTGLGDGSLRGLIARGVAKLREELAPWWRARADRR